MTTGPSHRPGRRRVLSGLGLAAVGLPAWRGLPAAMIRDEPDPASPEPALELRYRQPAEERALLQQGLPVGNGRLGALCGGPPSRHCLYLSEASLWLGDRNATLGADGQFPYQQADFGSFAMLAKLYVRLPGHDLTRIRDYRRSLDLAHGCVRIRYTMDGTGYWQTIFVSHPDDVLVMHLGCTAGGRYDGVMELDGTHAEHVRPLADGLTFANTLPNGLRFGAALRVQGEGGHLQSSGNEVSIHGCTALTIVLAGGTDDSLAAGSHDRDRQSDPQARALDRVASALHSGNTRLLSAHVADHRALFDTLSVDLGPSTGEQRALDMDDRLAARDRPDAHPDPELDALYLQYGRYLTIAGSRGPLPTNLQGLWLVNNAPPWMADYHTDINLEMNYWLPDRAGLSACFAPLTEYCASQYASWTALTHDLFNDPRNRFRNSSGKVAGWTVTISLNTRGGMGWWWHPAGSAWLCNNLWQHYQYTQDRGHLERIYPLMKEACRFWEARLVEMEVTDADGQNRRVLVDDHDWSPEQGPDQARGISFAQELVWDLFGNYRKAAALLGRDSAYAGLVAGLQDRLYLPAISPETGQLEEWMSPKDLGEPGHRHLSPLIGLFPGDRICADRSPPDLIAAARRLLEARGTHSTGWANAWRAICWARLKDGEKAYELVTNNLRLVARYSGTAINLFNTDLLSDDPTEDPANRIFQIDGNYGTPTAMLEMLLYSREGLIEILPALPRAWSAKGRVAGIGARGGFRVDVAWRQGLATEVVLHSERGGATDIRVNGRTHHVSLPAGGSLHIL